MRGFASRGGTSFRQSRTFGRFLAFLAVYIQILLPFIVVADLRFAGSSASAFPICHLDGSSIPGPGDGSHSAAYCPLCLALGAGAPFTAPAEPSLPLQSEAQGIDEEPAAAAATLHDDAVHYDARAPPLNG